MLWGYQSGKRAGHIEIKLLCMLHIVYVVNKQHEQKYISNSFATVTKNFLTAVFFVFIILSGLSDYRL